METSQQNLETSIVNIIKSNNKDNTKQGFSILLRLLENILKSPTDDKVRMFNINNEHLKEKVLSLNNISSLLSSIGYIESVSDKTFYFLSHNISLDFIQLCVKTLSNTLNTLESYSDKKNLVQSQQEEEGEDVLLLIYDISNGMAKSFSQMLLGKSIEGVWHTSIVIYGIEYFFGGGICSDVPRKTPYGIPVKEMKLGKSQIPKDLFEDYLKEINPIYTAESYNLISNNCNHFTNFICEFLIGKGIPNDILKQHEVLLESPMGKMILPMLQSMGQGSVPNAYERR